MQGCTSTANPFHCGNSRAMYGAQWSQTSIDCIMLHTSSSISSPGHHHGARTTAAFSASQLGACQAHYTACSERDESTVDAAIQCIEPPKSWNLHKKENLSIHGMQGNFKVQRNFLQKGGGGGSNRQFVLEKSSQKGRGAPGHPLWHVLLDWYFCVHFELQTKLLMADPEHS